jgi:hypothetical protein
MSMAHKLGADLLGLIRLAHNYVNISFELQRRTYTFWLPTPGG